MTLDQALAQLQNPDAQAQVRAVRWLRVLGGERAVAALIGALDDGSLDIQAEAVRALGAMQAREAVPALIERFQSDRPVPDRASAIQALVEGRDPRAGRLAGPRPRVAAVDVAPVDRAR